MPGSPTALAKLAIGSADPVTLPINFERFSPGIIRESRDFNVGMGSYDKDANRRRTVRHRATPTLRACPTALEWTYLLPWVMSGTPTGSGTVTYPQANTPVLRNVHFGPEVGEKWFITDTAVDVATIEGMSGDGLFLDLELIGKVADDTHSSFPSLTLDTSTQPFVFSDLTVGTSTDNFVFDGTSRQPRRFSLRMEQGIDRDRFLSRLTLTSHLKLRRRYMVTLEVPSGENSGLWSRGEVAAGVTLSVTFTNGSSVLIITAPAVRFDPVSPEHEPDGEGFLSITGELYRSGATPPVTVTLNPGP